MTIQNLRNELRKLTTDMSTKDIISVLYRFNFKNVEIEELINLSEGTIRHHLKDLNCRIGLTKFERFVLKAHRYYANERIKRNKATN